MKEYPDPAGDKVQPTNEMGVSIGLLNFKGEYILSLLF